MRRLHLGPIITLLALFVPAGSLIQAGTLASASFAQEQPGLGIRLLEAPEGRKDDPRARRFIVDHVAPGTTFSRRAEVTNGTDRPLQLSLYSAAASVENGGFVPAEGRTQNELSRWITLEPSDLQLAPGARAQVTITVAVPENATEGERYAAALVEAPAAPDPNGTVLLASRVGIRVYLSVGPGGEPSTDFDLVEFAPRRNTDGTPAVDIRACNTGGRALDLTGSLDLTEGPGGTRAGPFGTGGSTTVAPDECSTVSIPLDEDLPRGPWKATVTLRSGEREKKATATITFPAEAGATAPPVEAKEVTGTDRGRVALSIALLLLLLVLIFLAWLLWRRRRQAKKDATDGDGNAG